jgi:hypothetical protein
MFIGFRPLEPGDEADVLRIFAARADYFEAATGRVPTAAELQALFTALPAGASDGQRRLLAITADDGVVGVIDAVLDHPELGTVSLNLFLTDPTSSLRGFGMPLAALAGERALAEGIGTVYADCPAGWTHGEAFLGSLGFRPADSARPVRRWMVHLAPPPPVPGL